MVKKNIISVKEKMKKITKYLVIFLLIIFVLSLARNISRSNQVKKKVAEREAAVNKLREENEELQQKIDEMKSPEYIEKQIRDNLGLSKEGETVVILPDESVLRALAPQDTYQEEDLPEANWKLWLNLFI